MADLVDVEQALVTLIAATLYPSGTGSPSVAAVPIAVYSGWPTSSQLDTDLAAGKTHVTVFPTGSERNTTRYAREWKTAVAAAPTLTLTVSGVTVTVGGTVSTPQNAVLFLNGLFYVYQVLAADTLATIATALAALVPGATSLGAVITLPATSHAIIARVGAASTAVREIRRQERLFQITVWSNTPANRDLIAQSVDVVLADTEFLTMPDKTAARLIYKSTIVTDKLQKAMLYRRDLLYSVEYATTQSETETQITEGQTNIKPQADGATSAITTVTVNT